VARVTDNFYAVDADDIPRPVQSNVVDLGGFVPAWIERGSSKRLGRPTVIVDREKVRQCAAAGQSIKSIAKQHGIARATVRDILGRSRVAKNP
jgi:DNA invertase Pin-like site-specific DNA recombinase